MQNYNIMIVGQDTYHKIESNRKLLYDAHLLAWKMSSGNYFVVKDSQRGSYGIQTPQELTELVVLHMKGNQTD